MSAPMPAVRPSFAAIGWRQVVFGGLLLATLDGLFATTYWRLAAGVPWTRVFQSVAAGVLGSEASQAGGEPAAWLGLGLHYAIAMAFVVVYTLVARGWPALVRRPWSFGSAYGLWLYVAMNCIVIPLSAIGHLPSFADPAWVAASVAMHALFGAICAHAARAALRAA